MIRNKFLVNKLSASALSLLAVGLFATNVALQPVCAMDKELGDKMGKLSIAPKTVIPQTFEEWKEQMQQEQLKRSTSITSIVIVSIDENGETIIDEEALNVQEELKKQLMEEHNLGTLNGFTLKSFEEATGYSVEPLIPEDIQGSVKNSDNKLDDNMDESDDMNEGDDD